MEVSLFQTFQWVIWYGNAQMGMSSKVVVVSFNFAELSQTELAYLLCDFGRKLSFLFTIIFVFPLEKKNYFIHGYTKRGLQQIEIITIKLN